MQQSQRILVVEDNSIAAIIALHLLFELGYRPTAVTNGARALDALEKRRFDLVLMDVDMPVMNGIKAVRTIRASNRPYAGVPVVAVTGRPDRPGLLAEGMDEVVAKPYDLHVLGNVIDRLTGARSPARSASGAIWDSVATATRQVVPDTWRALGDETSMRRLEPRQSAHGERGIAPLQDKKADPACWTAHRPSPEPA